MTYTLLDDPQFALYVALICWVSVCIAGLGSELLIGTTIMSYVLEHRFGIVVWHSVQLFFSLLLAVALGGESLFGLPFLTIGLWKFGFPETVAYLLHFYTATNGSRLASLDGLLDGFGLLIHHFSTALTLVGIMSGIFPRSRAMTAACLPPIMQHWFALVRYRAPRLYTVLMTLLEAYFQWEVFANIQEVPLSNGSGARPWEAGAGGRRQRFACSLEALGHRSYGHGQER